MIITCDVIGLHKGVLDIRDHLLAFSQFNRIIYSKSRNLRVKSAFRIKPNDLQLLHIHFYMYMQHRALRVSMCNVHSKKGIDIIKDA